MAVSNTASHGLSDRAGASFAGDVAVVGYGTCWDTGTDLDYYYDTSGHTHSLSMSSAGSHSHSVTINSSGSGNGGNLPPYITKYVWERTA